MIEPPSGKRKSWRVRIWTRDPISGKRQQLERAAHGKREAERLEHKLISEREDAFGAGRSNQRLGAYMHWWLREIVKPYRTEATYRRYQGVVVNHIDASSLAKLGLSELDPIVIQKWVSSL